jgi:hypothetical protein
MRQPVWIIVGADDTVFTVADATVIHETVAGSRMITVAGANHIIVVNNPEVVEELSLDFIHDNQILPRHAAGDATVTLSVADAALPGATMALPVSARPASAT